VYIKRAILERSLGISMKILENNLLTPLPTHHNTIPLNRLSLYLSFSSTSALDYILAPAFHLHH